MLHAILQSCNLLQKDHPSLNLNQFSRQPHQPKHAVQGSTTSFFACLLFSSLPVWPPRWLACRRRRRHDSSFSYLPHPPRSKSVRLYSTTAYRTPGGRPDAASWAMESDDQIYAVHHDLRSNQVRETRHQMPIPSQRPVAQLVSCFHLPILLASVPVCLSASLPVPACGPWTSMERQPWNAIKHDFCSLPGPRRLRILLPSRTG